MVVQIVSRQLVAVRRVQNRSMKHPRTRMSLLVMYRQVESLIVLQQKLPKAERMPAWCKANASSARNCQAFFLRLDKPWRLVNLSFFFEKA